MISRFQNLTSSNALHFGIYDLNIRVYDDAQCHQFLKDGFVFSRLRLFPMCDFIDMLRQHIFALCDLFINRCIAGTIVGTIPQLAKKG